MLGFILGLPLVGFLINGLLGKRLSARTSGVIASGLVFSSFILSAIKFFELRTLPPLQRSLEQTLFNWISIGDFSLPFVLRFDPLTAVMCLVVTGVGGVIHVYSIGYMEHDRTPAKYFSFLNLFTFAMLALVLGGNLPILFLGWEGVGLCSYLLIGYWYEDDAKASAGKKAFIVNRIGDLGFLLGIFTLFNMFGTLDFVGLKNLVHHTSQAGSLNLSLLTLATCCMFVGAMGKSAQFPLYVWLPDAMAGPTPVSALIHAATMVTAGVYMIARLSFMYALCPTTLMLVSGIGAFTAIFSAIIATAQTDIKKVLAYSTVSQLGYMFIAVGVGAFAVGIFHLVTHAFFKALLFLGSGSVIHAMHEEQDITKMGGLHKYLPKTSATFAVGTIAIAGIPPLAGFFSKDEILWNAFSSHMGLAGPTLWAVGALTALLTAFYMTRLYCLTFLGSPRFKLSASGKEHHSSAAHHGDKNHVGSRGHLPHESPRLMVVPLLVLAVLSVTGGFLGFPGHSLVGEWLSPVTGAHSSEAAHNTMEYVLMVVSVIIAVSGMALGYYMYIIEPTLPSKISSRLSGVYRFVLGKFFVDEIFEATLIEPIKRLALFCWKFLDVIIVDGTVLGFAKFSKFSGDVSRKLHTGAIQTYAVWILMAVTAMMGYLIYGIHQ